MTGSLVFNRQYSSNVVSSKSDKTNRPKLRRCSSADEHNSNEQPALEISRTKLESWRKTEQSSSDIDSGTEDSDQNLTMAKVDEHHNDESTLSFGPCDDEGFGEITSPVNEEDPVISAIKRDLELASQIPHELKKNFCDDTSVAFHGEFARLISLPLLLANPFIRYHLLPYESLDAMTQYCMDFRWTKVDNAKAQFKCPCCHRSWTSMRARIMFYITEARPNAVVALKIFSQKCKSCDVFAEVLWYMEEVCRVMENLAETVFQLLSLPYEKVSIHNRNDAPVVDQWARSQYRHDPKQRHGRMNAPHDRNHCEACLYGICFQ